MRVEGGYRLIRRVWVERRATLIAYVRAAVRQSNWERMPAGVAHGVLAVILACAALLRIGLLARDVPTLDSDQAVVGLMALHLLRGEWSVFYWGQAYMGSLEALLVAPFLWLFGASSLALHLAPLCAALAFLVTVYLMGAALYSRMVGLAATALLAAGPAFFVVWSVRASGGYIETLLLGQILLLLVLKSDGARGVTARMAGLIGLVAGVAVWTNLLVLPYLIGAAVLAWLRRRTDLVRGWNRYALAGGFVLGVAPALAYNIVTGGATIGTILGLTTVGGHKAHDIVPTLPQSLWLVASISLPILCGTAFGGTQVAGYTPDDYMQARAAHPLEYAVALLIMLLTLALCASLVVRLASNWRALRSPESRLGTVGYDATPGADSARRYVKAKHDTADVWARWRMQGEATLLIVGLCYLAAFCLNKQFNVFATPRYLLPLYSLTPVVVGIFARHTRRLVERWSAIFGVNVARYGRLPGIIFGLLVVGGVYGCLTVQPVQTAALDHGVWITGRDDRLLTLLREHHVHTVISNDYWEGLRLTFESGESVVVVMVTPEGHTGFNRYQPYVARGLADPRPAYVELTGTSEAQLTLTRLQSGQLPGYSARVVGLYTVLVPA